MMILAKSGCPVRGHTQVNSSQISCTVYDDVGHELGIASSFASFGDCGHGVFFPNCVNPSCSLFLI
jgi:hypothetical protein